MKLEKLRKRQDFLAANGGRRWSAPGFVLLVRKRPEAPDTVSPARLQDQQNANQPGNLPDTDQPNAGQSGAGQPITGQSGAGAPRVGFTVTKRVGTSVVRNRLKRRLRALAREVLAPKASAGTDYVLIGRSGGLTRAYSDLVSDLERALRKLAQH